MSAMTSTKYILKKILPTPLIHKIQSILFLMATRRVCGFDTHLNLPDRRVLEDIIIPYFVKDKEFHKILFIGCDWYTKPYHKFFNSKVYWTIDIESNKRKYGTKNHIIDSIENLGHYIDDNYFDLIFFTGVFGHGLNNIKATETAIEKCFKCLRPGGVLVFGWNDIPEYTPFPILCESKNLKKFNSYFFPPLSSFKYVVADELRHTFVFFTKPIDKFKNEVKER